MSWTIEKARELPEDNIFAVKRIGPHAWWIGGKGDLQMMTGDDGVIEYLNQFDTMLTKLKIDNNRTNDNAN